MDGDPAPDVGEGPPADVGGDPTLLVVRAHEGQRGDEDVQREPPGDGPGRAGIPGQVHPAGHGPQVPYEVGDPALQDLPGRGVAEELAAQPDRLLDVLVRHPEIEQRLHQPVGVGEHGHTVPEFHEPTPCSSTSGERLHRRVRFRKEW
ncbi:hypothetical protein Saa2_05415 [Streptomyces acidiscabies]|nr:hypothetical protein Saa2_05415 [Streptomyces acidiscabies]